MGYFCLDELEMIVNFSSMNFKNFVQGEVLVHLKKYSALINSQITHNIDRYLVATMHGHSGRH